LEIGGGTGEKSLFYAFYGANVTLLEPNEKSCSVARDIFSTARLNHKLKIINQSLFDFDLSKIKDYDMICAEGVLHHTYDPIKSLNLIAKNMKQNQVILIAIGESHGMFKRELQKYLVNKLGKSDPLKIEKTVKDLFAEHLRRATNFDLRSEKSVIYDNFILSQDKSSNLQDICGVFSKNKILHLSSYPSLNFFYVTTPWGRDRENSFNYKYYENYYQFLEKIWMTCGEENISNDLTKFNIKNIEVRVEKDVEKLLKLQNKIRKGTFRRTDLRILQKGYMGVGLNYFVGMKENADSSIFASELRNYSKKELS